MIGAYIEDVKGEHNLKPMHLQGQSLHNYIMAASQFFALLTGIHPQYYDPATLVSQKWVYLHPYLQDKVTQQTTWSTPKPF
jgi:hypothetical protein